MCRTEFFVDFVFRIWVSTNKPKSFRGEPIVEIPENKTIRDGCRQYYDVAYVDDEHDVDNDDVNDVDNVHDADDIDDVDDVKIVDNVEDVEDRDCADDVDQTDNVALKTAYRQY